MGFWRRHKKNGTDKETHQYAANNTYTVKVNVSDAKASRVTVSASINTSVAGVSIDASVKYQTMEGFGGFGAKDVYWSNGPFTSADFTEPYESCVFNGEVLRDLIKLSVNGLKTKPFRQKLFLPEDIGYLDGVSSMVQPTLNDAEARQYISIIAVHGYALDGVTADSPDAQTWQTMYSWGAAYNMPLWMTETSGFSNDFKGAPDLAKAIYTAINFGNVSGWLHWQISEQAISVYSLMSSSGEKSKRYFASKNFYKYVRPGAYRIKASTGGGTNIYPLAFKQESDNAQTMILINDNATEKAMKFSGTALPAQMNMYVTSEKEDCKDHGVINISDGIVLPANAVITFYRKG